MKKDVIKEILNELTAHWEYYTKLMDKSTLKSEIKKCVHMRNAFNDAILLIERRTGVTSD